LKPENFLYERADSHHLKLADFGFARRFRAESRMEQKCGTPSYVAPEVLAASYTEKADLWSLGVIAFVMLLGKFPVEGDGNEFLDNLEKGHIVLGPRFQNLSPDAQEFLKSLVIADPTQRLSAAEALQHKWLQDHHEHKNARISGDILKSMQKFAEAPEVQRACLGVAAWVLPVEETLMLRELFSAIDSDGTGTITPNALRHAVGQKGQSDEDAVHIFTSLDTNGDGQVSYSEFLAGGLQGLATFHMDAVRETFNRLDANGDGFITAEELRSVVGDHAAGEITAENFLRDADYDGDDAVSLPEFLKFLEGVCGMIAPANKSPDAPTDSSTDAPAASIPDAPPDSTDAPSRDLLRRD
jgi:calcium-dependent protein kinase